MGRWSCFRPVTLESPPVSHAKLVRHFCAVRVASPRAMASSDMLRVLALCSAQVSSPGKQRTQDSAGTAGPSPLHSKLRHSHPCLHPH